ncbi:hypothetical protein LWI29_008424 [Acer saccharum]|uniref:Uncharacterized protein n=1 Tax=Acer saccharum TaxID=4024 RepID=A0AA39SUE3_ACESA|nr:hypothetical protein LWI29_008424 [Acer saccharum]
MLKRTLHTETADEIKEDDGENTDAPKDTTETSDEFKKWVKTNAKAEFVLKRSISHSLFEHIMRLRNGGGCFPGKWHMEESN